MFAGSAFSASHEVYLCAVRLFGRIALRFAGCIAVHLGARTALRRGVLVSRRDLPPLALMLPLLPLLPPLLPLLLHLPLLSLPLLQSPLLLLTLLMPLLLMLLLLLPLLPLQAAKYTASRLIYALQQYLSGVHKRYRVYEDEPFGRAPREVGRAMACVLSVGELPGGRTCWRAYYERARGWDSRAFGLKEGRPTGGLSRSRAQGVRRARPARRFINVR